MKQVAGCRANTVVIRHFLLKYLKYLKYFLQLKLADQILAEDKHKPMYEVGLTSSPNRTLVHLRSLKAHTIIMYIIILKFAFFIYLFDFFVLYGAVYLLAATRFISVHVRRFRSYSYNTSALFTILNCLLIYIYIYYWMVFFSISLVQVVLMGYAQSVVPRLHIPCSEFLIESRTEQCLSDLNLIISYTVGIFWVYLSNSSAAYFVIMLDAAQHANEIWQHVTIIIPKLIFFVYQNYILGYACLIQF